MYTHFGELIGWGPIPGTSNVVSEALEIRDKTDSSTHEVVSALPLEYHGDI